MKQVLFVLSLGLAVWTLPAGAELLTSEDSEEVVARQSPLLKKQLASAGFEWGSPVFVRIFKQSNELELWLGREGRFYLFRTYPICRRSGGLGPKLTQGDEQAPEGFYSVTADWMHPFSDFHLAFNIRYPNDYDQLQGRTGSAIMVHGGCSSSGCFAMTDEAIEQIYTLAEVALRHGQDSFKVHVFPFRLTEANLQKHRHSQWYDFWRNLQDGYDLFLTNRVPPNEFVVDGHYEFAETTAYCAVSPCQGQACERQLEVRDQALGTLWQEEIERQAQAALAAFADDTDVATVNEKAPPDEPGGAVSRSLEEASDSIN